MWEGYGSQEAASKCTLARAKVCHLPFLGKGLEEDFQTSYGHEHGVLSPPSPTSQEDLEPTQALLTVDTERINGKGTMAYLQLRLLLFRDLPEQLPLPSPSSFPQEEVQNPHSCIPGTSLWWPDNTKNTPMNASTRLLWLSKSWVGGDKERTWQVLMLRQMWSQLCSQGSHTRNKGAFEFPLPCPPPRQLSLHLSHDS